MVSDNERGKEKRLQMGSEGEQPKQKRSKKASAPWFIISIFIPAYFSNFRNLLNSPGQLRKHKFQSRTHVTRNFVGATCRNLLRK